MILLLFMMLFCHIVDDFYLQGVLAQFKQRSWWRQNCNDRLYRNDYKMALFIHGFSWTFMVLLPILIYMIAGGLVDDLRVRNYIICFVAACFCHIIIDNAKANDKIIGLVTDQLLHITQVIVLWSVWLVTF